MPRNRLVDTSRAIGDVKKRNHADHGVAWKGGWRAPEIDYIDKVPYRVVDTRSTVNGKGRSIKSEEATVASPCAYLCVEPRVHG